MTSVAAYIPSRRRGSCAADSPVVTCRRLVVGYNGRAIGLPPIDFSLKHHQLCAVVGRNGAGKTTWFRTLLGLLPPVAGQIETCSAELPMAYIPQRASLDGIVPLRASEVVAQGFLRGRQALRPVIGGGAARDRVDWALSEMGAAELGAKAFRELSEGQKQRVLMARLLASAPEMAVLDEPTAAMDEVAERETLELIDKLRREHDLAVMLVSHHLRVVRAFADQVVFLDSDGQRVVAGPAAEVFAHPAFASRYGPSDALDAIGRPRDRGACP